MIAEGLATGFDGVADGRGALDEGCGVGSGGTGIVDVGVGVDEGDGVGLVDGDPELSDGLGDTDGLTEGLVDGVPDTEFEGEEVPGVGVTSARAGMASERQIAAINAATALRRKT